MPYKGKRLNFATVYGWYMICLNFLELQKQSKAKSKISSFIFSSYVKENTGLINEKKKSIANVFLMLPMSLRSPVAVDARIFSVMFSWSLSKQSFVETRFLLVLELDTFSTPDLFFSCNPWYYSQK